MRQTQHFQCCLGAALHVLANSHMCMVAPFLQLSFRLSASCPVRSYMEATQLEQISYNLQQSKLQIRQMDESVQQVGWGHGAACSGVFCRPMCCCPGQAAEGRRPQLQEGRGCTAVPPMFQPRS